MVDGTFLQGVAQRAPRLANWPGTLALRTWRRRVGRGAAALLLPGGLLLLWQVAAARGWVAVQVLPPPALVAATFLDLVHEGDLGAALAASLSRIVTGFGLGASAGLCLGIGLGLSVRIDHYVGPLFRMLAQIPSIGALPFFILLFGLGETLNAVIIAKACLVPVALNTAEGIRSIPRGYREVGRVLRLRRRTVIFRVLLPAALPSVFTGIRLGLAQAWVSLIVVEMLAGSDGVGYLMVWGRTLFQLDITIVGMIVIGVIGFLLDRSLGHIERRLNRWAPRDA